LPSSPLIGKSLAQSGIEKLDLLPVGIIRQDQEINPLSDTAIRTKDILLVQGQVEDILKIKRLHGLEIREDVRDQKVKNVANIVEVEIAPHSFFIDKTLKQTNFRLRYGLSVIAVYRKHEKVLEKIGLLPLRLGDVLLIQGPQARLDQMKVDENFIFLNEV